MTRLSGTKPCREILAKLGHDTTAIENLYESVPTDTRNSYTVRPLPRKMNPAPHQPRRLARGSFILHEIPDKKIQACFVDAAQCLSRQAFFATPINKQGQGTDAVTVKTHKSEIAEQVANALTLTDPTTTHVYSDSRSAVKAFQKGAVARQALQINNTSAPLQHHTICWFPTHLREIEDAPPNLNEMAHRSGRDLTLRDATYSGPDHPSENRDPPSSYNEVTKHFYLDRRIYGTPYN